MKIETKECVAKLELDLKQFKELLKQEYDLENTVNVCLKVTEDNQNVGDKTLIRFVYFGFDWGGLLRHIKLVDKDIIRFRLFNVKLDGFKRFEPKMVSEDLKIIELKEVDINQSVMITQDAISNPNFAIDNLLCKTLFDFGGKKYALLLERN